MRINTNISALNAYRQLTTNSSNQAKSLEKLSSGFRINRAGDDAAGLAISEKMRAQIRGLNQASRNAQDGISLVQTAEGSLSEVHSILQRMRELATQASTDTNVAVDRDEIQKEINQLSSEINRIGNTTEFNTMKLLEGSRKNSYTTFTGNFGSTSGASTATVTGAIGVSSVSFTGSGLTAGSKTLTISKTAENHADQQIQDADLAYTAGNVSGTVSFSGNGVLLSAGAAGHVSGNDMLVTVEQTASGMFLIVQASGESGVINDRVYLNAGGVSGTSATYQYASMEKDAAGTSMIQFTITLTAGASGVMTFDQTKFSGQFAGGHTLGTELLGYVGANTGENNWFVSGAVADYIAIGTPNASTLSGNSYIPDTNMTWNIILSGASGTSGFRLSGVGADGTTIQDGVGADLSAADYTYVGFGLQFTLGAGSGADGDRIQFTTTPTYTWKASDGVSSGQISSGNSGGATVTAASFTGVSGISFSSAGLSIGAATFTVYTTGSSGTDNSLAFQIGANQSQSMSLSINDMRAESIQVTSASSGGNSGVWVQVSREYEGLTTASGGNHYVQAFFTATTAVTDGTNATNVEYALNMSTASGASAAITIINDAIETVSAERSMLGATQNRLEHTIANLGTSAENLQAAESRVRDLDMAQEMMAFTKNNILNQAATAMLAQANQQPQSVLQLLG